MPLDKVLIKHLDEQDDLERQIDEDIESIIKQINVKELLTTPDEVLIEATEMIKELLDKKYYVQSTKNGVELADAIRKDGDIVIQRSDDPQENKEQLG